MKILKPGERPEDCRYTVGEELTMIAIAIIFLVSLLLLIGASLPHL